MYTWNDSQGGSTILTAAVMAYAEKELSGAAPEEVWCLWLIALLELSVCTFICAFFNVWKQTESKAPGGNHAVIKLQVSSDACLWSYAWHALLQTIHLHSVLCAVNGHFWAYFAFVAWDCHQLSTFCRCWLDIKLAEWHFDACARNQPAVDRAKWNTCLSETWYAPTPCSLNNFLCFVQD